MLSIISNSLIGKTYYTFKKSKNLSPFAEAIIRPVDFLILVENINTLNLKNVKRGTEKHSLIIDNKVTIFYPYQADSQLESNYLFLLKNFDLKKLVIFVKCDNLKGSINEIVDCENFLPEYAYKLIDICKKKNLKLVLLCSTFLDKIKQEKIPSNIEIVNVPKHIDSFKLLNEIRTPTLLREDLKKNKVDVNACVGIISYLPNNETRKTRRRAFINEVIQLKRTLKLPIYIIAQNYNFFDKLIFWLLGCRMIYREPLGCTKAREVLREELLKTSYDGYVLFDDDELIESTTYANEFLSYIKANKDCFINYYYTFLRSVYMPRNILLNEPFINIDAQTLEGWDDALYIKIIKNRYPKNYKMFSYQTDFLCNIDESNFNYPSTWVGALSPWAMLALNTRYGNKIKQIDNYGEIKSCQKR